MLKRLVWNFYLIINLLLLVSVVESGEKLRLTIDSVYALCDSLETKSLSEYIDDDFNSYLLEINWTIKNIGGIYSGKNIKDLNVPWCITGLSSFIHNKKDKIELKNSKTTGNLLIKLFLGDAIYTPVFIGNINLPVDRGVSDFLVTESFSGRSIGKFIVQDISDSAYIQLEYNTLYQNHENTYIWRGVVQSQKYHLDKVDFEPCPKDN